MASLRDIRRRIKSVKNTAQITKAMQMVAASKMRKAQEAALHSRPYALSLNRILVSLRNRIDEKLNPLLEKREVKKETGRSAKHRQGSLRRPKYKPLSRGDKL